MWKHLKQPIWFRCFWSDWWTGEGDIIHFYLSHIFFKPAGEEGTETWRQRSKSVPSLREVNSKCCRLISSTWFIFNSFAWCGDCFCVSTEQVCEVLAGHVGSEGIRRDARSQCPRDGCTRLHLKRAQTVQSRAGKLCLCVLCLSTYRWKHVEEQSWKYERKRLSFLTRNIISDTTELSKHWRRRRPHCWFSSLHRICWQ